MTIREKFEEYLEKTYDEPLPDHIKENMWELFMAGVVLTYTRVCEQQRKEETEQEIQQYIDYLNNRTQ